MNGKKKIATGSTAVADATVLQETQRNIEQMLGNLTRTKSQSFSKNAMDAIMKIERELKHLEERLGNLDSVDSDLTETIAEVSSSQLNLYRNAIFQALSNMVSNILINTREIERLNDIMAALPNVNSGEHAARRLVENIDSTSKSTSISKREREVLIQLLGGKTNRQISRELDISEKTVKNHLWRIYRKLGVDNRTQLFNRLISG